MFCHQLPRSHWRGAPPNGLKGTGFFQTTSEPEREKRRNHAYEKRHAPAPLRQLSCGKEPLQEQEHSQGKKLSHDQSYILKARPEPPPFPSRHFAEVGRTGGIFPTNT